MAGTVLGIYMPDPAHLLVVPNIKTKAHVIKCLGEWPHHFGPGVINKINQAGVSVPTHIMRWYRNQLKMTVEKSKKPDKLGLPGGEIEDYELAKYLDNYYDFAFPREWVEETGTMVVRGKKGSTALFKRATCLFAQDRNETSGKTYEKFFFTVETYDGELSSSGVEGETEAPQVVPVSNLHSGNFYPQHAAGLKAYLRSLVLSGKSEFQESLSHLEKVFLFSLEEIGLSEKRLDPDASLEAFSDDTEWHRFLEKNKVQPLK